MSLQSKFFDLCEKGAQCEAMARDLLAIGDAEEAKEECRQCRLYQAQALLIVRNSKRIADLVGWTEEEPKPCG